MDTFYTAPRHGVDGLSSAKGLLLGIRRMLRITRRRLRVKCDDTVTVVVGGGVLPARTIVAMSGKGCRSMADDGRCCRKESQGRPDDQPEALRSICVRISTLWPFSRRPSRPIRTAGRRSIQTARQSDALSDDGGFGRCRQTLWQDANRITAKQPLMVRPSAPQIYEFRRQGRIARRRSKSNRQRYDRRCRRQRDERRTPADRRAKAG